MVRMTGDIRHRTAEILDSLPVGETFDGGDRVSIELTTQMLALLFDFPWEERRKLTYWSDPGRRYRDRQGSRPQGGAPQHPVPVRCGIRGAVEKPRSARSRRPTSSR
ncbi:putative linalool 8-monooxygenase-like [Ditylenchus destructor]|uniref:Linalool 8-monooxygenase-like n=1 Tax=Ditylenchus destructor TaxID=166010 RepID=A0AAD4QTL8_9BILA|nr:putative linalool 8-monooxygenase-like [Ditylenchus destructor]